MNELIAVRQSKVNGSEIPTVDARELYGFLGVKSEFRNWVKNRIDDFGFAENQDFVAFGKNLPSGGKQIEYHLTLDMAKELSMVERNEKGKQARTYFIACEKKLKAIPVLPDFSNPAIAARAWADQFEKRQVAEVKIKELEPKAEAFDHFIDGANCKSVARVAKEVGTGEVRLYRFLREIRYLMSSQADLLVALQSKPNPAEPDLALLERRQQDWNLPFQIHLTAGYFAVKTVPVKIGGKFVNKSQTLITPKGEAHIADIWRRSIIGMNRSLHKEAV